MPSVKDRRQTCFRNHLVEYISFWIIRVELLNCGVKFESSYPELLDQTPCLTRPHLTFRRINASERNKHIGILKRSLCHVFIRNTHLSRGGLSIDRENHAPSYAAAYTVFSTSDLGDRLHAIRVPTLIATGEHDVGSNTRMARFMHAQIPGSRLEILPGLRHSILVEAPELVTRLVRYFLQE